MPPPVAAAAAPRLCAQAALAIRAAIRLAGGREVCFVCTLDSDGVVQTARVAARENSAYQVNGVHLAGRSDAVTNILVDLAQRRTSAQSAEFAGLIVREGEGILKFHPDPRRSADFVVLRAPDVPSVLYESGFISNPADAERLMSAAGQQRFATVMARAIRIYFARQQGV